MRKLAKFMFALSDVYASVFLIVVGLGTIGYLFIDVIPSARTDGRASTSLVILTYAVWVLAAVGTYAVIRRRASGLMLMLLPSFLPLSDGAWLSALVFCSFTLAICGTPFLLAAIEASASSPGEPDAGSPQDRQQLPEQLRALANTPLDHSSELNRVQNRSVALSRHLQSGALADFAIPELVWHFLADADVRFKDTEYAAVQCDAIRALTDHWQQELGQQQAAHPQGPEQDYSP